MQFETDDAMLILNASGDRLSIHAVNRLLHCPIGDATAEAALAPQTHKRLQEVKAVGRPFDQIAGGDDV